MTKFNFEIFKNTRSRYGNITISISNSCTVLFNSGFYHKAKLHKYKYVQLAYDVSKKAVAFIFSNVKGEGIFTLVHRGNAGAIVARSFFKSYDIVPKESRKYEPKEYPDHELGTIFYVVLDENK